MGDVFARLGERWGSELVARAQVGKFSGGAISPKTLANADSSGVGPAERILIGRNVVYPVAAFIEWLRGRARPGR